MVWFTKVLITKTVAILSVALVSGSVRGEATELDVYGSIRQGFLYSGDDNNAGLVDAGSRFGLRGSHQLDQGLTGFGRLELGIDIGAQDSKPGTRLGYVGVSGHFGSISVGSQWSVWDNYVGGDHALLVQEGVWHLGTARNSRTVKYANDPAGITLEVDAVMQEDDAGSGWVDETQIGIGGVAGQLSWQAALLHRDGAYNGGGQVVGVRVGYVNDATELSLALANTDDLGEDDMDLTGIKLRASYRNGANRFLAIVTSSDNRSLGSTSTGVTLGFQHHLGKRTRIVLELASVDPDIAGRDATTEGGVVLRHDW